MRLVRLLLGVTFLPLIATITSGVASAQTVSGELDNTDPTMEVVFISTPNCTGQGSTDVQYDAYPFVVTQSGSYDLDLAFVGDSVSLYVFENNFDPAAAFPDCIAADNSGNPRQLTVSLTTGTQYFAVVFNDSFAQNPATYDLTFAGPQPVVLGAVPALTMLSGVLLSGGLVGAGVWQMRRRRRSGIA